MFNRRQSSTPVIILAILLYWIQIGPSLLASKTVSFHGSTAIGSWSRIKKNQSLVNQYRESESSKPYFETELANRWLCIRNASEGNKFSLIK